MVSKDAEKQRTFRKPIGKGLPISAADIALEEKEKIGALADFFSKVLFLS